MLNKQTNSRSWPIALTPSERLWGLIVAVLMNPCAHCATFRSIKLGPKHFSILNDFHGCGVCMTAANIGLGFGKSLVYLDIYNGPAYGGQILAYVEMGSWGPLLPGGSIAHGVTILNWTNGSIRGHAQTIVDLPDHSTISKPMSRVRTAARESPRRRWRFRVRNLLLAYQVRGAVACGTESIDWVNSTTGWTRVPRML